MDIGWKLNIIKLNTLPVHAFKQMKYIENIKIVTVQHNTGEVSRRDKQQIIDVCDGTNYFILVLTLSV